MGGALRSRGRRVLDHHLSPDLRPLALVPPEDQRARDVDGGVGAGQNAHQEIEGEVVEEPPPKRYSDSVARNTVPEVMIVRSASSYRVVDDLTERARTPIRRSSRIRSRSQS